MQYILNIFILLFVISSKKKFFFFSQINNFQIPNAASNVNQYFCKKKCFNNYNKFDNRKLLYGPRLPVLYHSREQPDTTLNKVVRKKYGFNFIAKFLSKLRVFFVVIIRFSILRSSEFPTVFTYIFQ